MEFVAQGTDGRTVHYVDGKRYLWLASLLSPLLPVIAVTLYLTTGSALATLFPLAYIFILVPLADACIGEDRHNPPEVVVPLMTRDAYYRRLLYAAVVLLFAQFLTLAWFVGTHPLPWWGFVSLSLGTGFTSAGAILVGHELGHKRSSADRATAQVVISALAGYGHFRVDHNRGHHVAVATPEDCASSRMGESIYRFVLREIPGALRRGWALERQRLAQAGLRTWSWHNEILLSWLLTVTIATALIAAFGWVMVAFLIIHHAYAWYYLTQANYIEHYGLLRQKLPNGRYEPPEPRHSWNTNHLFSNLTSFHVQRHCDHHLNALRPYQTLRDFDGLPALPSGYPGSFLLAMIPPLWFKLMDPKLMRWAGGDISRVNVDPRRHRQLYARYARVAGPQNSPGKQDDRQS